MYLYNSLTLKKEELPRPDPKAKDSRLFVCGPTVYDYPHIGNARTFMVFDIFARYLRSRGVKLFYLQNITDIDDKIINRAKEENTDWKTISRRYEKIFKGDMKRLGITSVDKYARATDFIPQIVTQVKRLIEKKHAYLIEGDGYYFDLKTFPEYGKLAGRTIEQAEDATSRIDASSKKRNRGDFCLWKLSHANSAPPPAGSGNANAPMRIKLKYLENFIKLLAPFAPHLAEELWNKLGGKKSIHLESWPKYDNKIIKEELYKKLIMCEMDCIEVDNERKMYYAAEMHCESHRERFKHCRMII